MDLSKFRDSPLGSLVPIFVPDMSGEVIEHAAFVPTPLPDRLTLAQTTYKLLGEAERELGRLDAQVRALPNAELLVRPALNREATSTSALEGTYAPLEDVIAAEHISVHHRSAETREIQNYVDAARLGFDLIKKWPLGVTVARHLQKRLVTGTRGDRYDAGDVRRQMVCIGDSSGGIKESRFVPPPHGHILAEGLSDWEKWLNRDNGIPLVAKMALSHYQFETLHPFSDGNGRIGRLLITLHLVTEDVLRYPVLNLSTWLEPRRDTYIDHLLEVSASGDYEPLIIFFATAIRQQSIASQKTVTQLNALQDSIASEVIAKGKRGMIVELARDLIGNPVVSVTEVAKTYDVSYPSARAAVLALVDFGILTKIELSSSQYNKLYVCRDVIAVLNGRPSTRLADATMKSVS